MRVEPNTGCCDRCGGLVIDAVVRGAPDVRLDAAPVPDGAYRAWNRGDIWIAQPFDQWKLFHGMRRRLHRCVMPDKQLELA